MTGEPLWALGVFAVAAVGVVATMLVVSWLLGDRHDRPATEEPYESGVPVTGSARGRMSVHFYLIAVFFVIFDLEAVYLFAWAIAVEEAGWTGFVEILVFVGILLVALAYLWRVGALDWGTIRHLRERGLRKELSP